MPGDPFPLQPVLAACTDQDSGMFAAHVLLAYHYNLRMVWFPGCCHQEDNIDKGTMEASGFSHLKEKVAHLGKFNHAPYKGGSG